MSGESTGTSRDHDDLIARLDALSDRVILRVTRIEAKITTQLGLMSLDLEKRTGAIRSDIVQISADVKGLSSEVDNLKSKMKNLIGNGTDGVISRNRKELETFIRTEDEKLWIQVRKFSTLKTSLRVAITAVWIIIAAEISFLAWVIVNFEHIRAIFK